jgi:hypothetical protein
VSNLPSHQGGAPSRPDWLDIGIPCRNPRCRLYISVDQQRLGGYCAKCRRRSQRKKRRQHGQGAHRRPWLFDSQAADGGAS